jgi:hypothetical protein
MLDQNPDDINSSQIYGLIGLYHRQFEIYKLALKQNEPELNQLINMEIILMLFSIHKLWVPVPMGENLKNAVLAFADSVNNYLMSHNDIPIDPSAFDGIKSCVGLTRAIRSALTSRCTGADYG